MNSCLLNDRSRIFVILNHHFESKVQVLMRNYLFGGRLFAAFNRLRKGVIQLGSGGCEGR